MSRVWQVRLIIVIVVIIGALYYTSANNRPQLLQGSASPAAPTNIFTRAVNAIFEQTRPKRYFVSFGNKKFEQSLKRIGEEARAGEVFDDVKLYDEKYTETLPSEMQSFIGQNPRGYGYWIWKSHVVKGAIDAMRRGDYLVYSDAGCSLISANRQRLLEYFEMIGEGSRYDNIAFQLEHAEHKYTKNDLFVHMMTPEEDRKSVQNLATIVILRKTANTQRMVDRWVSVTSNFSLLDDSPSKTPNHPSFIEHRHDQSMWSLIQKENKTSTLFITDESSGDRGPIRATRLRV